MEVPVNHVSKKAAGCSLLHDGCVLLAKRCDTWEGKPIPLGGYWSIFGGAIEEGENPMFAAIRELYEETGIKLRLPDLFYVQDLYSDFQGQLTEFSVYFTTVKSKPKVVLNEEHTEYMWFPVEKLDDFEYNIQKDLVNCIKIYYHKNKDLKNKYKI